MSSDNSSIINGIFPNESEESPMVGRDISLYESIKKNTSYGITSDVPDKRNNSATHDPRHFYGATGKTNTIPLSQSYEDRWEYKKNISNTEEQEALIYYDNNNCRNRNNITHNENGVRGNNNKCDRNYGHNNRNIALISNKNDLSSSL